MFVLTIASNNVIRLQRTGDGFVDLDLNRRMMDAKALLEFMAELRQGFVAGMATRHHGVSPVPTPSQSTRSHKRGNFAAALRIKTC